MQLLFAFCAHNAARIQVSVLPSVIASFVEWGLLWDVTEKPGKPKYKTHLVLRESLVKQRHNSRVCDLYLFMAGFNFFHLYNAFVKIISLFVYICVCYFENSFCRY